MKRKTSIAVATAIVVIVLAAGCKTVQPPVAGNGVIRRVTPETGVQPALDVAEPGDHIVLAPGTYYENLIVRRGGVPGNPVVIRAEKPGTAIISGVDPEFIHNPPVFEPYGNPEDGVYKARVERRVRWLAIDGRVQYPHSSLEHLQAGTDISAYGYRLFNPGARGPVRYLGTNEGFYWADGNLYVRHDPRPVHLDEEHGIYLVFLDPSNLNVEIMRDVTLNEHFEPYPPDLTCPFKGSVLHSFGIAVLASDVTIEGLRIYMSGNAGILVDDPMAPEGASDRILDDPAFANRVVNRFTVRDCHFAGCRWGLIGKWGTMLGDDLLVEHCEFASVPHWDNRFSAFVRTSSNNALIRHNLIYHAFDGIQISPPWNDGAPRTMNIHHNVLYGISQACFDIVNEAPFFARINHNITLDAATMFCFSRSVGGGIMIDHNLGYQSRYCIRVAPRTTHYGNTFVHNTMYYDGTVAEGYGFMGRLRDNPVFEEWIFANNILLWTGEDPVHGPWHYVGLLPDEHNLYHRTFGGGDNPALPHNPLKVDDPGFVTTHPMNFNLLPDSPAVDGGVAPEAAMERFYRVAKEAGMAAGIDPEQLRRKRPDMPPLAKDRAAKGENQFFHRVKGNAPDLGAIEHGVEWVFPRPGPRWANHDGSNVYPPRPPFPEDFDMSLSGF